MAGTGQPTQGGIDATGKRVVVVAGTWHEEIVSGLVEGSERLLEEANADYRVVRVAGAFELPVVAKAALDGGADAVIALGVIIRGGTPHFEYIAASTTDGLTRLALDTGKPVGFGVLTLDDEQQGIDRAGFPGSKEDKGYEAADAALRALDAIRSLTA
ncbi:6,7-dimethyl-8-ribityllumazine synthase [Microbacterium excoecariae]|uniref:6,7-dimethyl-8-ribityllumazine synthase n=1 Tax=Microbacterium excoecariae TaxID=2715210 RepID=UPI00140DD0A0|nr:6,7-dimethyl-8-ribityllumazine synthase [Microbacterium excoecariae]NHI17836.1 6,7-dimethyl-8-ribityllumazine synthase [Microbacterium excoecariae]